MKLAPPALLAALVACRTVEPVPLDPGVDADILKRPVTHRVVSVVAPRAGPSVDARAGGAIAETTG